MLVLGRVVEIRGGGLILEGGGVEKYLTNASDLFDCQPLNQRRALIWSCGFITYNISIVNY